MELWNSCCCCLLRPPHKDLNAPYVYLGVTNTFSDMLEECFQILFTAGPDYECGICEECEGRLRDASDFKLQVQHSQAELQARLEGAQSIKTEPCSETVKDEYSVKVELELTDEVTNDFMIQAPQKWEMSEDALGDGEPAPRGGSARGSPESLSARSQLAAAGSVSFEGLRDHNYHKPPHAARTTPGTSPRQRPATRMRVRAEQQNDRTQRRDLASGAARETYTCDTCGERFARKSGIVTHLKKHAGNVVCSKQPTDNASTNYKRTHVDGNGSKRSFRKSKKSRKLTNTGGKRYECLICNKKFTTKGYLIVHVRIHTGCKPYSCGVCSKSFSDRSSLRSHKLFHTSDRPYTCVICDKRFKQKTYLTKHTRFHTGHRPYSCEVCSKKFSTASNLSRHKLIHTGHKPHTCNICDYRFSQKGDLTKHIMRIHAGHEPFSSLFEQLTDRTQPRDLASGAARETHTCDTCGEHFARKSDIVTHLNKNAGNVCSKQPTDNASTDPKRTHVDDNGSASSKTSFRESNEKPYECLICNKKFTSKDYLRVHVRIHTGCKPYSCGVCSKSFTDGTTFRRHKLVHTGEKPYACVICDKRFTQNSSLTAHVRIHTGHKQSHKPFCCEVCSKKFSKRSTLNRHILIHTGDKPYSCNICDKRFSRKHTLTTHIAIHKGHKPFTCEFCSKKFSVSYDLKRHKLVHIGIKPYHCDTCDKGFTRKQYLIRHMGVHIKQTP